MLHLSVAFIMVMVFEVWCTVTKCESFSTSLFASIDCSQPFAQLHNMEESVLLLIINFYLTVFLCRATVGKLLQVLKAISLTGSSSYL